jgi:predicted nucleic acid-binding protein
MIALDTNFLVHFSQLSRLSGRAKLAGPKIHDARIAALCLSHGVELPLYR